MTKWITKKLGEIGSVAMCKRIFSFETSSEGEIPFYKIGTFGKTADAFITQSKYEEYKSKFSFPKIGDILLSASGTIGRTVVYDGKPAYFQDSNIIWLSHDEKIVLNEFLFYLYKNTTWNLEGSTIARLYNDNFNKIEIPIPIQADGTPDLAEQRRIAGILSSADGAIAASEALIEKYKSIKQGMLTDLLTPKKGWKKVKLGDVGTFKNGINKDKSQFGFGKMYISISDAYFEQIDFKLLNRLNATEKEVEEYSLITDDIIFVRSSVKPSGVGYTTLFEGYEKEPVLYSGFMIRYRLNDKNSHCAKFLNYLFRSDEFRRQVINKSTVSANTNINQESLKELVCFIPDLTEQRRIAEILSSVDAKIVAEEKVVEKYKGVKKGLMEEILKSEK